MGISMLAVRRRPFGSRRLLLCLLVGAVLASALALPAAEAQASRTPSIVLLEKLNRFRARHGVPPLHYSRSLSHSARHYAHVMMAHDFFGHGNRIHASPRFRMLGEIIETHRGMRSHPTLALHIWEHSGEHRSIMLMRGFRYAGAGYATGHFRGHKATIWVMHFGAR